jgi:hypothetical protein
MLGYSTVRSTAERTRQLDHRKKKKRAPFAVCRKPCHLPFHKLPKRSKPQTMTMPEPKLSYDLAAPTGEARFQVAEDERGCPLDMWQSRLK